MNVIDVRDVISRNAKAKISLEEAKSILSRVNYIIYEQSALEATLEEGGGVERVRAQGYKMIADVLGIDV